MVRATRGRDGLATDFVMALKSLKDMGEYQEVDQSFLRVFIDHEGVISHQSFSKCYYQITTVLLTVIIALTLMSVSTRVCITFF